MKRQVTIRELLEDPEYMVSDILLTNNDNPTEDILIKSAQSELTAVRRAISRKQTIINKHFDTLERTRNSSSQAKLGLIVEGQCTMGVGYIVDINNSRKQMTIWTEVANKILDSIIINHSTHGQP